MTVALVTKGYQQGKKLVGLKERQGMYMKNDYISVINFFGKEQKPISSEVKIELELERRPFFMAIIL